MTAHKCWNGDIIMFVDTVRLSSTVTSMASLTSLWDALCSLFKLFSDCPWACAPCPLDADALLCFVRRALLLCVETCVHTVVVWFADVQLWTFLIAELHGWWDPVFVLCLACLKSMLCWFLKSSSNLGKDYVVLLSLLLFILFWTVWGFWWSWKCLCESNPVAKWKFLAMSTLTC